MKKYFRQCLVPVATTLLAITLTAAPALGQAKDEPKPSTPPKAGETPAALVDLRNKSEELTLQSNIDEQQLHQKLAKLTAEKQQMELEMAIKQQKHQAEIADLTAQIEQLTKEAAKRKALLDAKLADSREDLEKTRLENDLAMAKTSKKIQDLMLREQELKVSTAEILNKRTQAEAEVAELGATIDKRDRQQDLKNRVEREIQYTEEPFKNGVLTISDRRIVLDGPITAESADYIAERIDYFNNQSTKFPIFLVIERSPGGSVMAGYKILKAMDGSPAPVCVVVKSYAASMAAFITSLAKKSYAYPNAIIMHHQMLSSHFGNVTEQREELNELEEWWIRLATPLTKKMGLNSIDDLVKLMYKNRSTGNWRAFGDKAKELHWVDEIAQTVRDESYIKNPDYAATPGGHPPQGPNAKAPALREEVDSQGHRFVVLPRLEPVDCYFLYNPDQYYRLSR